MANVSFIPRSKLVELLTGEETSGDTYVRVLTSSRLALGADPLHPAHVIDFWKERVSPYDASEGTTSPERPNTPPAVTEHAQPTNISNPKLTRRGGSYWGELNGNRRNYGSLKELLADNLRLLEGIKPGTLEGLSQIRPRSKRIVARDPEHLFNNRDLARKYSEQLSNGWWYGTNNSAPETETWLQRACALAGLKWGIDFKTSLTPAAPSLDELA
jgi:hypothetical protein